MVQPDELQRRIHEGVKRGVDFRKQLAPYRLTRPVKLEWPSSTRTSRSGRYWRHFVKVHRVLKSSTALSWGTHLHDRRRKCREHYCLHSVPASFHDWVTRVL